MPPVLEATRDEAAPRDATGEIPFDADRTLTHLDPPGRRLVYKLVSIGGLVAYAGYLVYRGLYTINPDALGFSLLVYGAEIHGFFSLAFYFFQLWELRGRHVPAPPPGLSVDVFITTYNEDVDLLRQTVRGALAMRYPHRTYVLDDGRRPAVKALAEELGCGYLTRDDNRHAKAGNWNHAFARTTGDVIATFDADHVPRANFLERTLGFFQDPRVALVQVPQRYHNLDSIQHRVSWDTRRLYGEQDVFFNVVQPGKDHWNAAFFCGTGAVLRREALVRHGGIIVGTITEDMHTSIVLHAEGWKSVYVNELLVTGLAPMDVASFASQRLRWAEGNLKIIRFINPVTAKGLTLAQRICYFASMYHWTIGVPKLIFYLAPPWMLFTGTFPIANFDARFLAVYAAFLTSLIVSYKILSRGTGRLIMDELFNMANVFTLNQALKRLLVGRSKPGTFVVTDKRGSSASSAKDVWLHYALLGFSVLALGWSTLGLGFGVRDDVFGWAVSAFWTAYNMTLMGAVIALSLRPRQKRAGCRLRTGFPVESGDAQSGEALGVTADISDAGCRLHWPSLLPVGTRRPFVIHLGPQRLRSVGEVVSVYPSRPGAWIAHGVRFIDHGQDGIDLVNDAVFNIAVPDLFGRLSEPSLMVKLYRQAKKHFERTFFPRAARYQVALPVRIATADATIVAATRDAGATGLGLVCPCPFEIGSNVRVTIFGPEGHYEGWATVQRCAARPCAAEAFQTWTLGLSMDLAAELGSPRQIVAWEATG